MDKFKLILVTVLMICIGTGAVLLGETFILSFEPAEKNKCFYLGLLWALGWMRIMPMYCGGLYKILITKKFADICTAERVKDLAETVCVVSMFMSAVVLWCMRGNVQ